MAETVARCGAWSARLGDEEVVQGLVATLSYRLEPEGFGSRFPVLLTEALAGRLEPAHASRAAVELAEAAGEARRLTPDRVVWSLHDRRRYDASPLPLDHGAATVYDYLTTPEGRPLLEVIGEGVERCRAGGEPLLIVTGALRRTRWRGVAFAIVGLGGAAAAYLYAPDLLIGPRSSSDWPDRTGHGSPLWAWLAIVGAAGLGELARGFWPRLANLHERHVIAFRLLIAVACVGWLALFWR